MKLLYATGNESKICNMRYRLKGYDVEVVTPKDLGIHIEVDEIGTTPIENARLKAKAYCEKANMPTLAADSGLFIDGIPDEVQPGLYVRRIGGKTLTDDEMIAHYSQLADSYGGKLQARYVTGLVLIADGKEYTAEIPDDDFIISSQPNPNRIHRGNPLDVVTICPANGKYINDSSLDELAILASSFDKKCIKWLQQNMIIPEKSCGAVVYTRKDGRNKYLLVKEASGFYSFPKGHIEIGETEEQAAKREIKEETGLELEFQDGFRAVDEYIPSENPNVKRQVVYFLAEYKNQIPQILSPNEVISLSSQSLEDTLSLLAYDGIKKILNSADELLNKE